MKGKGKERSVPGVLPASAERSGSAVVRKVEYAKEPSYFLNAAEDWDFERFPAVWAIGNAELLKCDLLALFCSRRCPGSVIRKSHDLAVDIRRDGLPVIGGFQTPVEKMCLEILVKGEQPVVVCPARGVQNMRVEPEWREALEAGRLLVVSPFEARQRRASKETAGIRNRFVAAFADRLLFVHASLNSSTLALADKLLSIGRDIFTLDMKENSALKGLGAAGWGKG